VQTVNVNENTNTTQMTAEEAEGIVKRFCDAICVPEPVTGPNGLQMNVEAVRARVDALLAKREERKPKPRPELTPGSESIQ
jgi:hypothetical protein